MGGVTPGKLWEHAPEADINASVWTAAVGRTEEAQDCHLQNGQARAAARAPATVGQALRLWGRHAEGRDHLTAAMEVLHVDPDTDTVRALEQLRDAGGVLGLA